MAKLNILNVKDSDMIEMFFQENDVLMSRKP